MALTITQVGQAAESFGSLRGVIADVTFSDSYPTGGEPLTPGDLGLATVASMLVANDQGYGFAYNGATLAVYDGPGTEEGNATDLSGLTVRILAFGTT